MDQLLIFAARSGNCALAKERLNRGGDPNYWDPCHGSAAAEAVMRGYSEMLSLLLERGPSPSGRAATAHGLIETAIYHQQDDMAVLLAYHGFRLRDHSREIYRERLERAFAQRSSTKREEPTEG